MNLQFFQIHFDAFAFKSLICLLIRRRFRLVQGVRGFQVAPGDQPRHFYHLFRLVPTKWKINQFFVKAFFMPVCPNCRNGRVVHWRNQRIGFCSSVLSFEQERKKREREWMEELKIIKKIREIAWERKREKDERERERLTAGPRSPCRPGSPLFPGLPWKIMALLTGSFMADF